MLRGFLQNWPLCAPCPAAPLQRILSLSAFVCGKQNDIKTVLFRLSCILKKSMCILIKVKQNLTAQGHTKCPLPSHTPWAHGLCNCKTYFQRAAHFRFWPDRQIWSRVTRMGLLFSSVDDEHRALGAQVLAPWIDPSSKDWEQRKGVKINRCKIVAKCLHKLKLEKQDP